MGPLEYFMTRFIDIDCIIDLFKTGESIRSKVNLSYHYHYYNKCQTIIISPGYSLTVWDTDILDEEVLNFWRNEWIN